MIASKTYDLINKSYFKNIIDDQLYQADHHHPCFPSFAFLGQHYLSRDAFVFTTL